MWMMGAGRCGRSARAGFFLLEVSLAVLAFLLAVTPIFRACLASLRVATRQNRLRAATSLAHEKLERLRAAASRGEGLRPEEAAADPAVPEYKVAVDVTDGQKGIEGLKLVRVIVTWEESGAEESLRVSTLIWNGSR